MKSVAAAVHEEAITELLADESKLMLKVEGDPSCVPIPIVSPS